MHDTPTILLPKICPLAITRFLATAAAATTTYVVVAAVVVGQQPFSTAPGDVPGEQIQPGTGCKVAAEYWDLYDPKIDVVVTCKGESRPRSPPRRHHLYGSQRTFQLKPMPPLPVVRVGEGCTVTVSLKH